MNMNRPDMTEDVKSENYTNKFLQTDSNLATMEMSKSPAIESSDQTKASKHEPLVYPDAGADAQYPEILCGVAQVVRRTGRDRQKLGDLLYPVNKRFVLGCFGLVRRFNGRGFRRLHCNRVRVHLQGFIRIIFIFHIFGHIRPIHIHRQTSNSL